MEGKNLKNEQTLAKGGQEKEVPRQEDQCVQRMEAPQNMGTMNHIWLVWERVVKHNPFSLLQQLDRW